MVQKTSLEVKLNDKILSVNGSDISLDESFINADSFKKEGTDYLELQYKTNDESITYEEAEKVYSALGIQGIEDIGVSPCPEGRKYQTVALFGEFDAKVYRR